MRRACRGAEVMAGRHLCRAELARVQNALAGGEPITIACTQEAPLFRELAAAPAMRKARASRSSISARPPAGRRTLPSAGPKMAALIAASLETAPEPTAVGFTSSGATVVYGGDERAIEAAQLLKEHLDVTVLIKPPGAMPPQRVTDFALVKGTIRAAKGYLGAFELTLDDYAQPSPSSRDGLVFGPARKDAHCAATC